MFNKLTSIVLVLIVFVLQTANAKQIALTFDDAPMPGSAFMSGEEKTKRIIAALKKHQVEDALFFVTTNNIDSNQAKERLNKYTAAGFHLANHSHAHLSANKVSSEAYLLDFYRAHLTLQEYDNVLDFHRFPYLHYGKTKEDRQKLLHNLSQLNQRIGYVTIDNFDWYLNSKLLQAHRKGKKINLDRLKQVYIDVLWENITFYDQLAKQTLGRSPKHVMLLHENEIAALFLDDLIAHIKSQGWQIITPQAAFNDDLAKMYTPEFMFNKQGRVSAIAHQNGIAQEQLRSANENTLVLDKKLQSAKVFN